jgi:hypothetical protein
MCKNLNSLSPKGKWIVSVPKWSSTQACLVREERVELSTFGSGGRRSIQLSYSRTGRMKVGQPKGDSNLFCAHDRRAELHSALDARVQRASTGG